MSRAPITADANTWTGLSDWPSPKAYPYPSPLLAKASPGKHFVGGGVAGAISLMALYGMYAPTKSGVMHVLAMGILAFCAAALAVAMLRRYSPQMDNRWLVRIDNSGLWIPSWFGDAVPWGEIENAHYVPAWAIFVPMRGLHLKVRDESRFGPTISRQLAQFIPFASFLWLLDVSQKEMFNSIQAHRAHFGNGGRAT